MPHNLSAELTSFVGREREIAQIRRFLSSTRLLTLVGAGGVGKTRLALRVAADLADGFPDGVWAIDLAPLADPALVCRATAAVLGVTEEPGRDVTETLVGALRDRALLLVLDNCEHLRTACAQLAAAVLRGCPRVRILATSREPLSVSGETLWRVPSLSVPDPGRVPAAGAIGDYEALRLFVERARARDARFEVAAAGVPAVVQICRRLDGIPLAIELAASRTRVLTVEQIAARLDDRFGLLTGGDASPLPRHQTLRATMDWSYGLLGPEERVLLRRLAVFSGGWTLDAAEDICAGDGVARAAILDLLTSLVDKSLVTVEAREGEARYRLLETVRQYARELLDGTGEAAAVHRRHRDWYAAFAERADAKLYTSEQVRSLAQLEAEHDNLRAALGWTKADPEGAAAGLRLAGSLGWFWYLHGHWSEGRTWLEGAIARAGDVPPSVLPEALLGAGRITWFQGETDAARPHFERGLALCRELRQTEWMPGFLYWLGRLALGRGDMDQAAALLEEGLAVCRERGDTWWTCQLLAERGEVALARGDHAAAETLFRDGLAISRATAATNNTMLFLHNLGAVAVQQGCFQEAVQRFTECLGLSGRVRHRAITGGCFEGLAQAASGLKDYLRAARLFGAAAALEASLGRRQQQADQDDRARHLAAVRAALGGQAFERAFDEGRSMALEEAIAYAQIPAGAPRTARAPERVAGGLTARECEVAALIARGLTNRQIAATLVVTERTAETHVQNVLNKLGFSSRTQIAAWAVEQGLSSTSSAH